MPYFIARDVDFAGGSPADLIPSTTDIFVEDELIILDGDDVAPHGGHGSATVNVTFTDDVFGNDKLVAVGYDDNGGAGPITGDKATCDHKLTDSQTTVTVNYEA